MGFYTHKEVEAIKRAVITDTKRQMKVEFNREKNHLIDDYDNKINCLKDRAVEVNKMMKDLNKAMSIANEAINIADEQLKEKDTQIHILKTFLKLECDKEIKRLEIIAKRTKKEKIKKKCENRIIDYKMRKLAYEK